MSLGVDFAENRSFIQSKIQEFVQGKDYSENRIFELSDTIADYIDENKQTTLPFREPLLSEVIKSGKAVSAKGILCPWCSHGHNPDISQLNHLGDGAYEHICKRCHLPAKVRVGGETLYYTERLQ